MVHKESRAVGRFPLIDIQRLCRQWGWFLALGIALILLGTLALAVPLVSTISTVFAFGGILLTAGVLQIIQAFWAKEWKGFFLHVGIVVLNTVVGFVMLARPYTSALSLTLVLAVFFMVAGLFKAVTAFTSHVEHRGWMIFSGVLSFALGLLILLQLPASSAWVLGTFIGIGMLLDGWMLVMLSLKARSYNCHMHRFEETATS